MELLPSATDTGEAAGQVLDLRTGEKLRAIPGEPLLSSEDHGWRGFVVRKFKVPSLELENVSSPNHLVVLQLSGTSIEEWTYEGVVRRQEFRPGQLNIIPADFPHSLRVRDGGEVLIVSFSKSFLASSGVESGVLDGSELRPSLGENDPLARELIRALGAELGNDRIEGRIYAESLASLLAIHLLRKHSRRRLRLREGPEGLAKSHLRQVLDYIHTYYPRPLPLAELAKVADLSPFHFARQFKQATGLAPHQYLTRFRVERAKHLLMDPRAVLQEVARQVGFCDQSHLTRHFQRAFGLTPAAFMRHRPGTSTSWPEEASAAEVNGAA